MYETSFFMCKVPTFSRNVLTDCPKDGSHMSQGKIFLPKRLHWTTYVKQNSYLTFWIKDNTPAKVQTPLRNSKQTVAKHDKCRSSTC